MSFKIEPSDAQIATTIKHHLNQQMLIAAEPLVQSALKDIERAMRERLAAELIAQVESSVTFERHGADLRVTIKRPC